MQTSVYSVQKPLKSKYKEAPESAMVIDHAKTSGEVAADPFHSKVEPMDGCGVSIPVGVHAAVGGLHDAPTPGDLLCAAQRSLPARIPRCGWSQICSASS